MNFMATATVQIDIDSVGVQIVVKARNEIHEIWFFRDLLFNQNLRLVWRYLYEFNIIKVPTDINIYILFYQYNVISGKGY